ncbi:nucleotidyl transferase AbiEii/AbiGii toxin family protein [Streptomyces sp. NBC_00503]|uniref:nucleotidyl transferase AbiEii/AbiGii toxin family protein n=1 Tax=Streptomyces sp. NBC_00503 TaxID=2903659 RepID=UPI002E815AF8|nr:nucleotidyl transferase AbiEii/AbiGii toxin family protein [Streptomyces sp. NBC_00503]WUD81216.1 nucleotidyl transferase AbiEii/AbiGii toxin family protein [Streptomyces sp. NBC_00503]
MSKWSEFGWQPIELPREPLDENTRAEKELPRTLRPVAGDDVRQQAVFDPSLKHLARAYRAGDPVFDDPQRTAAWARARRAAMDAVLLAVSESEWVDSLVLRGSVLLADWFGEEAREPGDLDFVVVPQSWHIDDGRTDRMLEGIAASAAGRAGIKDSGAIREGIWTYDRVPGTRLVLPWEVPGLPAGQVQLDFVFNEELAVAPEPVELACGATVLAASPALSLAWKVMWLVTDDNPQGKDLYDAVLLAEEYPLSYELLLEVFRAAEAWPMTMGREPDLQDVVIEPRVDREWRHFAAEYPHLAGPEQGADYKERLLAAIYPTFRGRSTERVRQWLDDAEVFAEFDAQYDEEYEEESAGDQSAEG